MSSKSYPLRLPENLLKLAEIRSKEERVDKSTALRQLMYEGAENYVLELIDKERLSIGLGAEILERAPYEIYRLAEEKDVDIGATMEQYKKGKRIAERKIEAEE
ncbi:hypothetical protein AKJ52_02600 [candidate division MSBL1 archaeon SCGC-AAA382C18]|uniref:Ribbon-helix-helix protein CopG domain-containing protein n=1 Tax=candidate division MSBL1 archaeon SCGC-AAA382C18 TaxID=1698281 RepID=A0A133VHY4_9EURY|nr:hypothetical protein AKJ52_02600 [candidate division MSBL1 archaeon SCGC-AAA382C18]